MKNIIGIVILGITIYLLKTEISETTSYLLYSLIVMIYALHLLSLDNKKKIGVLLFVFSFLFINNKFNENNVVNIKQHSNQETLIYKSINDIASLEEFIKTADRPIFIDYYADWCVSCVKMNNTTLKNPEVIKDLNNNYYMVKIDLTDITPDKKLIMDKKSILAIPYYSMIEKDKSESIYTGELDEDKFKELLIKHNR